MSKRLNGGIMILESKRLRLRPVASGDIKKFVVWFNDPEVTDNLALYSPVSEVSEREWLRTMLVDRVKTDIVMVIELRQSRPMAIGTIGIHKIDHRNGNAEISIVIGEKKFWGKGLAAEATALALSYGFDELNLHRFYTGVYSFNERSIRSLTGQGFQKEGIQREAVFKKGKYHDVLLFAMLRADWDEIRRRNS